ACAEALAYLSPDDARAEKATEALLRDRDRGVRNVTRRVLQEMGKLPASAKPSAEDGQVDSEQ
ncbi:MAG: hypothetical protein JXP34_23975, partial [Planctomycetes bacterium]|nr:hypothetical protein [Planctomycetota bacterium]